MLEDDDIKSSGEKSTTQVKEPVTSEAPVTNVVPIPEIVYDVQRLNDFIDLVFGHVVLDPDEHILTWHSRTNLPGFPMPEEELLPKLSRIKRAQALYYGISTCKPNENNELRCQKALFKRLFVIVLDDIGTKVDPQTLPPLDPTYIIETSPGNHQWGFVLEHPIDNVEHAEALIDQVHQTGFTDTGGKLATKLVRLPGGVNGKKGPNRDFEVHAIKTNGPRYTIDDLLTALGIKKPWAEILTNPTRTRRRIASWSPVADPIGSTDVVDVVLNWLHEKHMVQNDTGDWVSILCPWSADHTTGDAIAGYRPLGRGSDDDTFYRAFHCFHAHCQSRTTQEFLNYVMVNHGPMAPVGPDPLGRLLVTWAYEEGGMCLRLSPTGEVTHRERTQTLKHILTGRVAIHLPNTTKPKVIPVADYWLQSDLKLITYGQLADPRTTDALVKRDGKLFINTYHEPPWGDGSYEQSHVDRFVDFITYLIPDAEQRDYFLQWLAAKVQDQSFRGSAILMTTPTQGIGRTTLSDILRALFLPVNVSYESLVELTSGKWNSFLTKTLVVVQETLDLGIEATRQTFYNASEKLKALIDTRSLPVTINHKYGRLASAESFTSFLLFSNHFDALAIDTNDRRIYVIENERYPRPPDYFTELNAWLDALDSDGKPLFAPHLWRWLKQYPVDLRMLNAPAPMTDGKTMMIEARTDPVKRAVRAVLSCLPTGTWVISNTLLNTLLAALPDHRFNLNRDTLTTRVRRAKQELIRPILHPTLVKVGQKPTRWSYVIDRVPEGYRMKPLKKLSPDLEKKLKQQVQKLDEAAFRVRAAKAIEEIFED